MKKALCEVLWKLIPLIWVIAFTTLIAVCSTHNYADECARKAAMDDEYLDICEFVYEHDHDCDIVQMYYHYEDGKATWLCVDKDDESRVWLVCLELKKVAPFRYEWVEVE